MDILPISQLEGRAIDASKLAIRAVVTLIWPYSSSTKRAALLLAELDFRLRKSKGQVRVQLVGAAAEAIARSKISSGDEIVLGLIGAKRVEAAPGISTPGKSVDVELEYRRRIKCEIFRDNRLLKTFDITDRTPSEPSSRSGSPTTPYEPARALHTPYLGRVNGLSTPASSAFHRRARVVSGELVDSPYEPFASDRKTVGHERKRQRLSWGGEARWTMNDTVPSPSKEGARDDWIRDADLHSPKKTRAPITTTSPSPEDKQSARLTTSSESQVRVAREQYTQELVDMVSGDTEEEDFSQLVGEHGQDDGEDEDEIAVSNAFSAPQNFERSRFAVFRDQSSDFPLAIPQRSQARKSASEDPVEHSVEASLQDEKDQLPGLVSSDPLESKVEQVSIDGMGGRGIKLHVEHVTASSSETMARRQDHTPTTPPRSLRIANMPPPILPALQTSSFTAASFEFMPPPPASALPGSPKTPDLRPQHSSALPLPSPFPGEELSSYMDVTPQPERSSGFLTPPAVTSPLLPDWMLQLGHGFGSQGFLRDSPPKQSQYNASLDSVEEDIFSPQREQLEDFTERSDMGMAHTTHREQRGLFGVQFAHHFDSTPTHSAKRGVTSQSTFAFEEPMSGMEGHIPMEMLDEPGLPSQRANEVSRPPPPSDAEVIVLSSDQSDESEEMIGKPSHGAIGELGMEMRNTDELDESKDEFDERQEQLDENERIGGKESTEDDEEIEQVMSDVVAEELVGVDKIVSQDWSPPTYDGAQEAIAVLPAPVTQSASTLLSARPAGLPPSSAPRREPIVIDLLEDGDDASEEDAPQAPTQDTTVASSTLVLDEERTSSPRPEPGMTQEVGSFYQPSTHDRPGVSFAPRVTRRRAALEVQQAAEFDTQSPAPLASSQPQQFPAPRLRVQDTFEGMAHSDGSVTIAPPSRGSDIPVFDDHRAELPIDDEVEAEGSPTPTQSPALKAFDGAMDFIASSPPMLPLQLDELSYPELPPFTDFQTAPSQYEPFETARQPLQHSHLPVTPEASQQLFQQLVPVRQPPEQHVALPPSPHLTQITDAESFYSTTEGHDVAALPVGPEASKLEMREVKNTPTKTLHEFYSDGASSVLSPWFGKKLASKTESLQQLSDDNHITATQLTETLKADDQLQLPLTVDQGRSVIPDSNEPAVSQVKAHEPSYGALPSDSATAAQEMVTFDSQLPSLADFSFTQSQATQVRGLLTNVSYYTPLSNLFTSIRIPSNSQGYNDNCVDVIAIVSKATTKPLRADKGQRDYYTTLSITDEFFYPRNLRVQIFRPWRAALPKAEKGDVILLRSFEVFSAKGNVGVGLKSGEGAAWCVWHFSNIVSQDANSSFTGGIEVEGKPWTRRERREALDLSQREDMRGPPVELGEEEREFAGGLRSWWDSAEHITQQSQASTLAGYGESRNQGVDGEVAFG